MIDRITEFIDIEIGFHSEIKNPWYWRVICKIFGKKECHVVVVKVLEYIKDYIERIPQRDCADCGKAFLPVNTMQWWCPECLLKRYNDCRKFGIDYNAIIKEPEMTQSGPGGS